MFLKHLISHHEFLYLSLSQFNDVVMTPVSVGTLRNAAFTWNHADDRRQETPCEPLGEKQTVRRDDKTKHVWKCVAIRDEFYKKCNNYI